MTCSDFIPVIMTRKLIRLSTSQKLFILYSIFTRIFNLFITVWKRITRGAESSGLCSRCKFCYVRFNFVSPSVLHFRLSRNEIYQEESIHRAKCSSYKETRSEMEATYIERTVTNSPPRTLLYLQAGSSRGISYESLLYLKNQN